MEVSRAKYLAEALVRNNLTRNELDDFLKGLRDDGMVQAYSEVLESHFNQLIEDEIEKNKSE